MDMDADPNMDPNMRRLKKAVGLTKKLQDKVKFEREVNFLLVALLSAHIHPRLVKNWQDETNN
jgi:hypothetical protein